MDIEKLIEQLSARGLSNGSSLGYHSGLFDEAATALSTLQAENAKLRESRDHWKRLAHELSEGVNGKDAEHERLQAENEKLRAEVESFKKGHCAGCSIPAVKSEQIRDLTDAPKLRAELEQVKAERDAAVKDLNEFLAMDELCPIQCEWCKWKDTFCDGKTPEWRGIKED